jgi:hypothetical protein
MLRDIVLAFVTDIFIFGYWRFRGKNARSVLKGLAVHKGMFLFSYGLSNKIICLYSLFILSEPFSSSRVQAMSCRRVGFARRELRLSWRGYCVVWWYWSALKMKQRVYSKRRKVLNRPSQFPRFTGFVPLSLSIGPKLPRAK